MTATSSVSIQGLGRIVSQTVGQNTNLYGRVQVSRSQSASVPTNISEYRLIVDPNVEIAEVRRLNANGEPQGEALTRNISNNSCLLYTSDAADE